MVKVGKVIRAARGNKPVWKVADEAGYAMDTVKELEAGFECRVTTLINVAKAVGMTLADVCSRAGL